MKLKGIKLVVGLFSVAWSLFLSYKILEFIDATELMWFLFWTNIPMIVVVNIVGRMMEK